jgi:hypothetical protein
VQLAVLGTGDDQVIHVDADDEKLAPCSARIYAMFRDATSLES